MKVIVAGSRQVSDYHTVVKAINLSGFEITELVSGGAIGVDRLGEEYAKTKGIPIKSFIPDWDKLGRSAGIIRNGAMADYAEALIAVHYGWSKGTANMIEQARTKGLKVYVYKVEGTQL